MKKLLIACSILGLALLLLIGKNYWYKSATSSPDNRFLVSIGRLICGGHLPLAVVEKKFQTEIKSFQLKTVQNHNWNDVVKDMKSGKLAGTFILSPLAMQLIEDGLPAKIVLKADRNGNAFVLTKKIEHIDELKAQKSVLAVPHLYSQHHVLMHTVLQQHQIPANMTTIIPMSPRDMVLSLQRGEIDGFMVGEPEGQRAVSLNVGWVALISPEIWKDHMDHVFIASDEFIEKHPKQLQELVSLLVKAGRYIEQNPHEAAQMGEEYTGAPAQVFERVLTTSSDWISYSDMLPSDDDIQGMAEKLVDMGLWKNIPEDLHKFTETRFIEAVLKNEPESF